MQVVSRRPFNDQCPTGHLRGHPNAGHTPEPLSPPCLGPTRPKRAQICQRGRRAAAVQICCRSTLSRRQSNTFATSRQERASAAAGIVAGQPAQPPPPRHRHNLWCCTYIMGPMERPRGPAGAVATALPRNADGARPPGAMEKADADATKAARAATDLAYIVTAKLGETPRGRVGPISLALLAFVPEIRSRGV